MSPFDRARMTSYRHSIATMALSSVVSETFNVENDVTGALHILKVPIVTTATLKSGSEVTQGH